MQSKVVTIINKLGLHARAAARFVQLASSFDSEVNITVNGKKVSGKSIMGIMMLAASKGTSVEIVTAGADEEEAIQSLENLILDKFGEAE
ncbi:MAG: HPr family phosphocarrier protein [Gammaproteobacteria bacterium]|nr:HPr family phosphocarrier protein [Gammaproteobacteria bacterium]